MFNGRRPVKGKVQRLPREVFRWFGARSRIDVVAQQVLDHDEGIFKAVKRNDIEATVRLIDDNKHCLLLRDSVGAAPVHVAFLFGHYELGKQIVMKAKQFAGLTYSHLDPDAADLSPYEGENVLHIAIVHRKENLARWLVREVPELISAEATGKFFRPSKGCYFGGTPLLFALSSNQINVALDILDAADRLKARAPPCEPTKSVLNEQVERKPDSEFAETSIFMCDRYGNNVLHMAVIHDLPNVYNFALLYVMHLLSPLGREKKDDDDAAQQINASEGITTMKEQDLTAEVAILYDLSPSNESDRIGKRLVLQASSRLNERLAGFTRSEDGDVDNLVDFMERVDDASHDTMLRFLTQRNSDELTPLSLAAAIANQRMFQHILKQSTSVAWRYGPITAMNVPLLDLEQPIPRPDPDFGKFQIVHDVLTSLPYPLAPRGKKGYKTAIQCLCSLEPLSNTLPTRTTSMQRIVASRLEMLKLLEVKLLLQKKWKYVGKQRFMTRLVVYLVFLLLLNATTLFQRSTYTTESIGHAVAFGIAEVGCIGLATVKFMNETNQLMLNFKSYTTEAGAGRLDNVCTLMACTSLYLSAAMRVARRENLEDAFAAVALLFSWLYLFFFLLGFRSTGPFVIMILNMIANDIVRFIFVYFAVMAGFSQALYLVQDGRAGVNTLLHRIRMLVIAGFTGEVNYDDNYTSGRMNPLTQVLMLGYIILVMILLVNLLIAMYVYSLFLTRYWMQHSLPLARV